MQYDLITSDKQPRAANARFGLGLAGLLRASAATAALLGAPALAHADPAAFAPPAGVTAYRLLFVTYDTTSAVSSNISNYNSFVTSEAALNTALPTTTWSALLSTPTVNAVSNISCGSACDASDPIYLVDGSTLVATSADALFAGTYASAPAEDQFGDAAVTAVWTGSNADGTAATGDEVGSSGNFTAVGFSGDASPSALSFGSDVYNFVGAPVYAVSAEIAVPEPSAGAALLLGGLAVTGIYRRRRARG